MKRSNRETSWLQARTRDACERFEKARAEVERGRLWRAKEILQGAIPNCGYNLELYEQYGKQLMQLGDLRLAGKFLFLSGARRPEYEQAIDIYLSRYKDRPGQLFRTFPRQARLIILSTYPKTVAHDLLQLGFPNNLSLYPGAIVRREIPEDKSWVGKLPGIIAALVVIFFLMLLFLGYVKLKELFIFKHW